MKNEGLRTLYIDEFKNLHNSAETQLVEGASEDGEGGLIRRTTATFEQHLEQTKQHVQRLEQIFTSLDESPKGKKCAGMEGLVKEGAEMIEEDFEGAVMDAGLIGAAQRVEHYEIAARNGQRIRAKLRRERARFLARANA